MVRYQQAPLLTPPIPLRPVDSQSLKSRGGQAPHREGQALHRGGPYLHWAGNCREYLNPTHSTIHVPGGYGKIT